MDFLKDIRESIYGPEYYSELQKKPAGDSFKYFFILITVIAFVSTFILLFSVLPAVHSFFSAAETKAVEYYPQNLEIKVDHGSVSANVTQPYFLPLPAELKDASSSLELNGATSTPTNLLVIDTKDLLTVDEFKNDSTLLLLASDSVAYVKDGSMVIQPLSSDVSFTLNQAKVISFIAKVDPYLKFAYPIIAILMLIGLFIGAAFRLVYLFILALLIWLIAHLKKINLGYKKSYQLGLHLVTLPLIVTAALSLFIQPINIPFLFTIIAVAMAVINLKREASKESSV